MKIKNLIAVAALLLGSTSAFAIEDPQEVGLGAQFVKGGLVYQTSNIDSEELTADAIVLKVSDNAAGLALIEAGEISIPATLTVNVDDEDWTITVTGVDADWATTGSNATEITTLSVDETNFEAAYADFSAFTKLTKLTLTDRQPQPTAEPAVEPLIQEFPTFADAAKLVELDIENCLGITAIPEGEFLNGALETIKVPASLTTINASAFEGSALTSIDLSETALTTLGARAFYKSALEEISLPAENEDFKVIAGAAFQQTALTAITIPATIVSINGAAFANTAIKSVAIPASVTAIGAGAFKNCENLATVTFGDEENESALATLGGEAFMGTIISTIDLPEGVTALNEGVFAGTKFIEFTFNGKTVAESAFESCTSLKTFNFAADEETTEGYSIDYYAFVGCNYPVTINTSYIFATSYLYQLGEEEFATEPLNCVFNAVEPEPPVDPELDPITTVNGFAKWFNTETAIAIDPANAKVFSVYVDNNGDGTIYFQSLKLDGGLYVVQPGEHVIIQSLDTEAEGVEYEIAEGGMSVLIDEVFTFTADQDATVAKFQKKEVKGWSKWAWTQPEPAADIVFGGSGYNLYRLTNKNGIGFSQYTGTTLAEGQFFVQSIYQPDAEGRAKVVWLDEDGNVIDGAATAIQGVKTAAEVGAIYNVAGQKVGASYKGLVIKDGKKYIQK